MRNLHVVFVMKCRSAFIYVAPRYPITMAISSAVTASWLAGAALATGAAA